MKKNQYHLNKISLKNLNYLLFLLIPLSFIIGIAAVNIVLFLISILFITNLILEKNIKILFDNITFKTFFFFLIYIFLVTSINSEKFSYSEVIKIVAYIKYIFLFFFISYVYLNLENEKKIFFLKFNLSILVFFLIDLFFQYLTGSNILGYEPGMCFKGNNYFILKSLKVEYDDGYICQRFAGLFNQEFIAGTFLLVFGSILIFLKYSKKNNLALFGSLNLLIFFILITGDRTPLLLILSSVFLFFIINTELRKYLLIWVSSSIVIFLILILISPQLYVRYAYVYDKVTNKIFVKNFDKIKNKTENNEDKNDKNLNNITNNILENFYNTPWGAHYVVSSELIKDKPLFGHGLKTFRNKCLQYLEKVDLPDKSFACSTHPHNFYLEFLIDFGIFGLIFLLVLISSIFYNKNFINKLKQNPMLLFLSCLLLMIFFPLKPSGSFFSTTTGTTIFYILGWIKFLIDKRENEN